MPKPRTAARPAVRVRRAWRTPDALWAEIAPLLPPGKPHPLGCHNPRVDDRRAMDAIFPRLRTGCRWNALSATGLCSASSAYRRFYAWTAAGVFHELWRRGLTEYDALTGIEERCCRRAAGAGSSCDRWTHGTPARRSCWPVLNRPLPPRRVGV